MSSQSPAHLLWASGHLLVLLATLITYLNLFNTPYKSYYLAYLGVILSWGIVVYKSLGVPQPTRVYLRRALMDENVQYLVLALYWFTQKPILLTLLPFATFSLFHTLTFIRTSLLPKPAPVVASTTNGSTPTVPLQSLGQKSSRFIQIWVKANYEQAMQFVSYIEVILVFSRLLFGALLFRNSFLAPLIFAHFLRLRFYLSPPTRLVFALVNKNLDAGLEHKSCPAGIKSTIQLLRSLIIRYSESVLAPNTTTGPSVPTAAAGGARPPPPPPPAAGVRPVR